MCLGKARSDNFIGNTSNIIRNESHLDTISRSIPDNIFGTIVSVPVFEQMMEKICFAGHTHELELIEYDGQNVTRSALAKGMTCLDKHRKYILNIGSVGQPRDGNPRACYVTYDVETREVEMRRVEYDIEKAMRKILAVTELDDFLGHRLLDGR